MKARTITSRVKESVLHLLYPTFSELDAIALLYALTIAAIEYRVGIREALTDFVKEDQLTTAVIMVILGCMLLFTAFEVIQMARHTKKVARSTKIFVSTFFYFSIGFLTVASCYGSLGIILARKTIVGKFLLLVQGISFLRAVMGLALLRDTSPELLAGRFNNQKVTRHDLLLIALLVPVFYWFNYGYDVATLILVSYFYAVVLVTFLHDLEKVSPK